MPGTGNSSFSLLVSVMWPLAVRPWDMESGAGLGDAGAERCRRGSGLREKQEHVQETGGEAFQKEGWPVGSSPEDWQTLPPPTPRPRSG